MHTYHGKNEYFTNVAHNVFLVVVICCVHCKCIKNSAVLPCSCAIFGISLSDFAETPNQDKGIAVGKHKLPSYHKRYNHTELAKIPTQ